MPLPPAGGPPRAVSLEGLENVVCCTAFFPDGNRIVTAGWDHNVRVFDAHTGRLIIAFDGHKATVQALAVIGPDLVATGDIDGVICVFDARAKCCLYRDDHIDRVGSLAALSSSRFAAGLDDGTLLFFHHRDGEDIASSVLQALPGAHSRAIESIDKHGERMVTGSGDGTAKVWKMDSREVLTTLRGHDGWVRSVSISATHIVTATRSIVHIWDACTFSLLHKVEDIHADAIRSVLILGSSSHVLTASQDATVAVSVLATGAIVDHVDLEFEVYDIAVTNDGRMAACGFDGCPYALVFPAPDNVARIIRAPAAAAALRILGWQGGQSSKGFDANSAEVRSWRAVANLPSGL